MRFVLELRALPGWKLTPERRLRYALKCLLRSFGLRCVACRPKDPKTKETHETV
jgi:hypothetical protein